MCPSETIAKQRRCAIRWRLEVRRRGAAVQIPADAQPTDITFTHDPTAGARYIFKPGIPFGVPFAPTPFRAKMVFTIGGEAVSVDLPIEARYSKPTIGGPARSAASCWWRPRSR